MRRSSRALKRLIWRAWHCLVVDGADRIHAGAGDDTVVLNADNVAQLTEAGSAIWVDGGAGLDRLVLDASLPASIQLDLTRLIVGERLTGFEHIDITGQGDNRLDLNVSDVLASGLSAAAAGAVDDLQHTHVLRVDGNVGDVVRLSQALDDGVVGGHWQAGSALSVDRVSYHAFEFTGNSSVQVWVNSAMEAVLL